MSDLGSLYIERNICGDCYRCLRECAVKAIRVNNRRAEIVHQMCLACGSCIGSCPKGIIKQRNDVLLARQCIKDNNIKVASVSPSWISEFKGIKASQIVEALKLLGFTHVSESSLGAKKILEEEKNYTAKHSGLTISSRCPAVKNYIHKYHPTVADSLMNLETPMVSHARMIKKWWGSSARVIHISPCIAAKGEVALNPDLVELAITFNELKGWLHDEGIQFDLIPGHDEYVFEPFLPADGLLYEQVGINKDVNVVSVSGISEISRLLKGADEINDCNVHLDVMACRGGCLGSYGSVNQGKNILSRGMAIRNEQRYRARFNNDIVLPDVDVVNTSSPSVHLSLAYISENEISEALSSLGIEGESQLIDCNGCGYVTCRRFAKALCRGMVDKTMCTHYVIRELHEKFFKLLAKMASGVMVIDSDMNIVEANDNMATMLGVNLHVLYNGDYDEPSHVDARAVVPFYEVMESVLESGADSAVKDVQVKDRLLNVSVYSIRKHRLLLVIVRNMIFSQVRNEEIIVRTQKVIHDNLDTVRQIAYLLGENASRTEAVLNSILNYQKQDNVDG